MGKKKPAASNARGFSTTSVPASASSAAAAAAAAAATAAGGKKKPAPAWTADPPAPDPPRVANPVAAPKPKKKDVKAAKLAEKEAAGTDDAVSKRLADFAKDARVGKLEAEIRRQKDDGLGGEAVVVPTRCERMLVDYLVAGAPAKFKLAHDPVGAGLPLGRDVTLTDDVNKLLRDLHLVHVACEEHLGLDRATVHKVMRLAPAPWDLQAVLHTASLVVPGEKLPRGWADKVYFHQMTREERELAVKREEEERGKRRGRGGRGKGKAKEDAPAKADAPKQKQKDEQTTPKAAANADAAAAATMDGDKPVTAEELNLDLDAINVFDLPESATSSDAHKSVPVRSFSTDGWTGKVPKQLLRDTMVREDRNVKIGYPDAKREKGVRAPPSAFRVQCVINGKSYVGPDYCNSRLEAEHCAAVVGLYNIAKGRPLHRMLPPAYREVWMEVEAREKGKVEESQRVVDSEKVNYLTGLVDMFKAEGVMGINKKPKPALNDEAGQARSTSASPTPSNSDRSNRHRSNTHATPAPTRRDSEIQAQRMSLPVAEYQADIQRTIRDNQVVIIAGETGSGKSTQVPQFVLEDVIASGGTGQIFCTQPRRISATSIATRVASEWGDARAGDTIGYSVKLESKVSSKTRLVFCTTGILLRRLESDPTLQGISHVLVDEVHERSLDSDFLLVMLRRLTATRSDLRIVLMSATMNESQFSAYFDRCPVLSIPGRTFPVERMYLEDVVERVGYVAVTEEFSRGVKTVRRQTYAGNSTQYWEEQATTFPEDAAPKLEEYPEWVRESVKTLDPTTINYELIEATVDHILSGAYDDEVDRNSVNGAILVFLPGIGEIRRVFERLKRLPNTWVLPLHSSLSPAQQAQVFKSPPRGTRKIVLSTNIAETGVTIPDAVFVIDTGKAKITRYDEKKHMTRLRESFVTQANCRQRQGRAGRVRPGFYFALYSQYRHDHLMADFEVPEVQRMALESTTLKIKVYHFDDIVDTFRKFLDPPPTSRVLAAIERLQATRALDEQLQLTPLGRFLGELPLDVELGKILAFGAFYGCIDAAVTIAAYLSASVQLFDSGSNWQSGSGGGGGGAGPGGISRELLYGRSDLLTYYNIFRQWKDALKDGGAGKARAFCNRHSLNYKSLTIIDDTRSQLVDLLPMDFDACNRYNHCLDMIHTALVAAAYPNVLKLDGSARTFVSARGTVTLHGASIFSGESGTAIIASMHAAGILQAGVQVSSAMAQAAATASRDLSPFYCYFTCLHASQILVFDATNVHPLLMAFAVGCQVPLKVNYVARTIAFDKDGVAKIRVPPKTAAHLVEFHLILTRAFEQFLLNPRQADAPGVGDVVDLLYAVLSAPQSSV